MHVLRHVRMGRATGRHTCCAAAGAAKVIACEWNPNAVQALRRNLELNRVADRCHVLEGDCRLTAPKVSCSGSGGDGGQLSSMLEAVWAVQTSNA